MATSRRMALWGGHECTINRIGDQWSDQTARTGLTLEDLDRFADLGLARLRLPVLWETGSDSAALDIARQRIARLRARRVEPIIGLIHHGSGPPGTSLLDPGFAPGLAAHAAAVARAFPDVMDWTPVNEPLTTARFSCRYGLWYPHLVDEGACWTALLNQIDATRLAMREIRAINPAARLVQTDDLGEARSTPQLAGQRDFENHRRWLTWDLLAGRVVAGHPLWDQLCSHGLEARLRVIADDPCPADVIGINHYLSSNRFLTHRVDLHPGCASGDGMAGVPARPFANIEAVRCAPEQPDMGALLDQVWARYGTTIAVTECHNGCTREEQLRWFWQVWRHAEAARDRGVDVEAVTAWALLGSRDWNSLLTRFVDHYEVGVWDARVQPPRATAMVGLLTALAHGEPVPHRRLVETPGWWQREGRYLPGYGRSARHQPVPDDAPPVLITGKSGTLAQMLARACAARGLACRLVGRSDFDPADPAAVQAALERHRPWAIINCAGMVDIDRAEAEPDACHRANAMAAGVLAAAAARRGIGFVQLSTDQVFGGGGPCLETDALAPRNVYGATKAEGEQRVLDAHPQALVARTAAFFSPHDRWNFAVHCLDQVAAGRRFAAAADQLVSPTYVPDLADALLELAIDGDSGIRHLVNAGGMSWADFARTLANAAGFDPGLVRGLPTASLALSAERPGDVRLGTERGPLLPTLEHAITRFVAAWPGQAALATAAE